MSDTRTFKIECHRPVCRTYQECPMTRGVTGDRGTEWYGECKGCGKDLFVLDAADTLERQAQREAAQAQLIAGQKPQTRPVRDRGETVTTETSHTPGNVQTYVCEAAERQGDPKHPVRYADVHPDMHSFADDLAAMGYDETTVSAVLNGGPRGEVEAPNGDRIMWSDKGFRGTVAVSDLTVPVERLTAIVESAKASILEYTEAGHIPDTVVFWGELHKYTDANMLGTLGDDENMDIWGDDLSWIHQQVENWLWDGRPAPRYAVNASGTWYRTVTDANGRFLVARYYDNAAPEDWDTDTNVLDYVSWEQCLAIGAPLSIAERPADTVPPSVKAALQWRADVAHIWIFED